MTLSNLRFSVPLAMPDPLKFGERGAGAVNLRLLRVATTCDPLMLNLRLLRVATTCDPLMLNLRLLRVATTCDPLMLNERRPFAANLRFCVPLAMPDPLKFAERASGRQGGERATGRPGAGSCVSPRHAIR